MNEWKVASLSCITYCSALQFNNFGNNPTQNGIVIALLALSTSSTTPLLLLQFHKEKIGKIKSFKMEEFKKILLRLIHNVL